MLCLHVGSGPSSKWYLWTKGSFGCAVYLIKLYSQYIHLQYTSKHFTIPCYPISRPTRALLSFISFRLLCFHGCLKSNMRTCHPGCPKTFHQQNHRNSSSNSTLAFSKIPSGDLLRGYWKWPIDCWFTGVYQRVNPTHIHIFISTYGWITINPP